MHEVEWSDENGGPEEQQCPHRCRSWYVMCEGELMDFFRKVHGRRGMKPEVAMLELYANSELSEIGDDDDD